MLILCFWRRCVRLHLASYTQLHHVRTVIICSDIDVQAQFSVNQSRPEEITMKEGDIGNITLVGDDGFGRYLNEKTIST